jgi:hypothetical protein
MSVANRVRALELAIDQDKAEASWLRPGTSSDGVLP